MAVWGGLTNSCEKKRGEKQKRKGRYKLRMQSSKEEQEEIRKPSSVISAKKQRKTTELERLEISSRKLEIGRECFRKMDTIKERDGMDITEAEYFKKRVKEYIEELHKKDIDDPDNTDNGSNWIVLNVQPYALHKRNI